MDIQEGKFYKTRNGGIVKIVKSMQILMRPYSLQIEVDLNAGEITGRQDDQAYKVPVECFLCWMQSTEEVEFDYPVNRIGQACFPYKLVSGENLRYAFPPPEREDQNDLVEEVTLSRKGKQRFKEKTFLVTHEITVAVTIRDRHTWMWPLIGCRMLKLLYQSALWRTIGLWHLWPLQP